MQLGKASTWLPVQKPPEVPVPIMPPAPLPALFKMAGYGGLFIRLAGLSGAVAVGLGAYGAHSKYCNCQCSLSTYIHEVSLKLRLKHESQRWSIFYAEGHKDTYGFTKHHYLPVRPWASLRLNPCSEVLSQLYDILTIASCPQVL